MTYYATRRSIKDGKVTTVDKNGEKVAMERQFYLFCASAATNEAGNSFDAVEWGTLEGGKLDRKVWNNAAVQ